MGGVCGGGEGGEGGEEGGGGDGGRQGHIGLNTHTPLPIQNNGGFRPHYWALASTHRRRLTHRDFIDQALICDLLL